MKVLIVEDEDAIALPLAEGLSREGFDVVRAATGAEALAAAEPDIVLLDLRLPDMDGLDLCRQLRERSQLPIIIVTARGEEADRVVGLELGADDYVIKPFSPREVVARVKAIARRAGLTSANAPVMLTYERLEIDQAAREARVDGVDVGLKPREFALLLELAVNPGVALSRSTLLQRVWGYDFDGDERTVDVHVRRLRLKLEEREGLPMLLHTVHGFGYRFARA